MTGAEPPQPLTVTPPQPETGFSGGECGLPGQSTLRGVCDSASSGRGLLQLIVSEYPLSLPSAPGSLNDFEFRLA